MPTLNFPSPSSETSTRANTLSAQSMTIDQQRQKSASPQPSVLSTTFSSLPPITTETNYPLYTFQRGHRSGAGLGLTTSSSYGPGPNVTTAPGSGPSAQRRVPITTRTSPDPSNTISSHQHSSQSSNFPGMHPSHARLSTLYEPAAEALTPEQSREQQSRLREHHSNRPKAKQPEAPDSRDHDSLKKIVDGVLPKGNFQLTTEHESPSGTPTSLLRGLPAVAGTSAE